MTSKAKKALAWLPLGIITLAIGMSAGMKLAAAPQLVEIYTRIGLISYMRPLGAAELIFLSLFLYKRTLKVGFLLMTAFYGGAVAIELTQGALFIFPAILLTLVWIAAWLRDASLFTTTVQRHKFISTL